MYVIFFFFKKKQLIFIFIKLNFINIKDYNFFRKI